MEVFWQDVRYGLRTLVKSPGFAFGAALLTGFVVGIVPAIRASRGNLAGILHEGGRTVIGGRQRFRNVMVVVQVGASLMLLIMAGLFTRSLAVNQQMRDLGFDPNNLMNFYMDPMRSATPNSRAAIFTRIFSSVSADFQAWCPRASPIAPRWAISIIRTC
jgi:hypothetical protein